MKKQQGKSHREREREREKQDCGGGRELLSKQTREEGARKERDSWRRKLKRIFAARGIRIYCNLSDIYLYLFLLPGTYFVLLSLLCILKLEEDDVHVVLILFCFVCCVVLVWCK